MNEYLAQLYGTGAVTSDETLLEKQAAAELLIEVATENGVDLSDVDWDDVSVDEIKGIIDEMVEKTASAEETEDEGQEKVAGAEDEEAMALLAQADFMGRAMAHAYYAEAREIEGGQEKTASADEDEDFDEVLAARAEGMGRLMAQAYCDELEKTAGMHEMGAKAMAGAKGLMGKARGHYGAIGKDLKSAFGEGGGGVKARASAAGRAAKKGKYELAGAGGAAAALIARKKMKKKQSSAFDTLVAEQAQAMAQNMALQMLAEAGYEIEGAE